MLIIQINYVYSQALEASITGRANIIGLAVHPQKTAVAAPHIAKLSRDDHLIAAVFDGFTYQLFVVTHAIHIGRIEQGDS